MFINALDRGDIIKHINPNRTYTTEIVKPGKYDDELVYLIDNKTGEVFVMENAWAIAKFWEIVKEKGQISGEEIYDIWFPKGWLGI
jgi:hypothetical protein